MKRITGRIEAIFDICYLLAALGIGAFLLATGAHSQGRMLAGIAALVLGAGDAFHLIPRVVAIKRGSQEGLWASLGRGKQITSLTMTVFYLLLWQLGQVICPQPAPLLWTGILWILALARIILCLLPQNQWQSPQSPARWGIWRNIPFFLMGVVVMAYFFLERAAVSGLAFLWLAILLSFLFYGPVVLWAGKNPKLGMLMLPKTCAYLWMLAMFLSL